MKPDDRRAVLLLVSLARTIAWYRGRSPVEIDYQDAAQMLNRLPSDRTVTMRPVTMADVDCLIG
jgi:hypothetical protein